MELEERVVTMNTVPLLILHTLCSAAGLLFYIVNIFVTTASISLCPPTPPPRVAGHGVDCWPQSVVDVEIAWILLLVHGVVL